MNSLPPSVLTSFREILPSESCLTDEGSLQHYGRDWLKDYVAAPSAILLPITVEQISNILALCNQHQISVVPSGGRTGLSGGATATNGEVVLSLEKMRKIISVSAIDRTITCEAGVPLEKIQAEALAHNLYYPVDFSSRGSSQIGGNIATNAGGIRVIKYGNTRDWVLGLKVVTPNGEILSLNGSLFKNNTGLDLRSLFIGSEGILGIIVECTLKLTTPPRSVVRALCGLADKSKLSQLLTLSREKIKELSAFEYLDLVSFEEVIKHRTLRDPFEKRYSCYVVIEIEEGDYSIQEHVNNILMSALEANVIDDVVVSESAAQAKELMEIRDLIGETLSTHYTIHKNDISVPVPDVSLFVEELSALLLSEYPTYRLAIFGHLGDGNLHVNILKPEQISDDHFWQTCHTVDQRVAQLIQKFRGSVAAEHGVGIKKRPFLHYSRSTEEIRLMRGIKAVFDPNGIMNPGKVL